MRACVFLVLVGRGGYEVMRADWMVRIRRQSIMSRERYDALKIVYDGSGVFRDSEREHFVCFFFKRDGENLLLLQSNVVAVGDNDSCNVSLNEVQRQYEILGADEVITVHNHPSGFRFPSKRDIQFTRELIEFSRKNNISVYDHAVLTSDYLYSLRENKPNLWK